MDYTGHRAPSARLNLLREPIQNRWYRKKLNAFQYFFVKKWIIVKRGINFRASDHSEPLGGTLGAPPPHRCIPDAPPSQMRPRCFPYASRRLPHVSLMPPDAPQSPDAPQMFSKASRCLQMMLPDTSQMLPGCFQMLPDASRCFLGWMPWT